MANILVTGAAGFLGFHLARALQARGGDQIFCVDNFCRGEVDDAYENLCSHDNVKRVDADLSDPAQYDDLPDDIDCIYHLAALNGTQNFYERPMDVIRSCTLPTMYLVQKYGEMQKKPQRFLYAGTSESYASTVTLFDWPVPTAEDVPLSLNDVQNPRWSYAASKMHGEIVTLQAARSFGFDANVIRFHNAYGPRMGDKHVVPDFMERMRNGRYELFGHADTRSFLYVDDAVRATVMVAENPNCANEIINIGGPQEITMLELAQKMLDVRDISSEIELHDSPAGSVKRRAPDVAKLQQLTGFQPQVSLEDGLLATAQFYLDDVLCEPLNGPLLTA